MTDIPSAYDSVPSHASAGTTPVCGACGRPVVQTWFYINARAFHPQCLALYDVGYRDEITRLRSRVAELEGAATKAAEIIKRNQNHQWEKITDAHAILRAVILSQSTENGNG